MSEPFGIFDKRLTTDVPTEVIARTVLDGDVEQVKKYRDQLAKNSTGFLRFASTISMIKYLVSLGANPINHKYLLHFITADYNKKHSLDIVEYYVSHYNIDINEQDSKGNTPLHGAIYFENIRVIPILIWLGADAKILNKKGESSVDITRSRYPKCVSILPSALLLFEKIKKFTFAEVSHNPARHYTTVLPRNQTSI